ncbi:unnamed protein product [Meganyctiphanes norvegica]|uniref:phospholipase D n=1 Tax=Meganyctiphanes norvegica TaxID=48144 RepID=A0AAV2Q0A2_MEGNR
MVVLYGRMEVLVLEANELTNLDNNPLRPEDKSDPYVLVEIQTGAGSTSRVGKTHTIDDCLNPKWYYKIATDVNQDVHGLKFTVKDRDIISSDTIGTCLLPVHTFTNGPYEATLNLVNPKGFAAGTLRVKATFYCFRNPPEIGFVDRSRSKANELKERASRKIPKFGEKLESNSFTDMVFLHGVLDIHIQKADKLPNLDSSILSLSKKDVSDPFVVVELNDIEGEPWKVATTSVIDNNLNPQWDEHFKVDICHEVSKITLTVRDKDFLSSEIIGIKEFPVEEITSGSPNGTYDLWRNNNSKKAGSLTLSITFTRNSTVPGEYEVPACLYPLQQQNHVTLYQDTHCNELPLLLTSKDGGIHQPRSTWRDIHTTITQATKFIYFVGWSVSTKIALLRDEGDDNRTIGEILKQKSYEGVKIRLLLWDELTSDGSIRKQGAMSTEDEETLNFFNGTSVIVQLVPRERLVKDMFSTKKHFTGLCYTHHQKCVIADSPIQEHPGNTKLIAFVGGLDLTGGRYDSPEHPLFRTLIREHKNDFRNRVFPTLNSESGPREPWHDIHSRIEGPLAYDVMKNFEERWRKQAPNNMDALTPMEHVEGLMMDYKYNAPDSWNVQVFRSINTDSADLGWTHVPGLKAKKGRAYDDSLHRSYIHNIRRARRMIYVENQYFMGSSHMWPECRDAKAGNLVPLEISLKIEDKIRNGERFMAYILIPMFPEGRPADKVIQEIIHWQYRTMQMMYSRVAAAIKQYGVEAHPQDYLLFLCLGKKETAETVPQELVTPQDPENTLAFNNRRHMIYVHSKMAIFDDEYIIVGSANINDRSLSGNRDTEIAIGAYQPAYTGQGEVLPYGDVGVFRRSLWAEHMGSAAPVNMDAGSIECARTVRNLGEESLRAFLVPGEDPTPRHLLIYPYQVTAEGVVTPRPDCPMFPDTMAGVCGARSKIFPSSLTT